MATYTKIKGSATYTIEGSPTIIDEVVSGFSSSDYLKITVPSGIQANIKQFFEIQVKVTMPDTLPTTAQFIYFPVKGTAAGLAYSSTRFIFSIYSSTYRIRSSTNIVQANETVWIKGIIKNNIAELLTSSDGINWTSHGTLDITDMPTDFDTIVAKIGINGNLSSSWAFTGQIDLNETYIKLNNSAWFGSSFSKVKVHLGSSNRKIKSDNLFSSDYIIDDGKLKWAKPSIYLKNDGTNYIDTGYVPKRNTAIILDFKANDVRELSSNTRNWICGNADTHYANPSNFYGGFWFQGTANSNSRFWLNTTNIGAGQQGAANSEDFILNKYRLILVSPYNINYRNTDDNGCNSYIIRLSDNTTIYTRNNLESNWGDLSTTFTLFNRKQAIGSAANFLLGDIYTTFIYEDNNLVMKLVPVPKDLVVGSFTIPSNGMFDIVNQQFYPNVGTGTFTYGKDVV